jgi:hypothetical protein
LYVPILTILSNGVWSLITYRVYKDLK